MKLSAIQNYYAQNNGYIDWRTLVKRNNIYEMEIHWRKLNITIQKKLQQKISRTIIENIDESLANSINKIVINESLIIR